MDKRLARQTRTATSALATGERTTMEEKHGQQQHRQGGRVGGSASGMDHACKLFHYLDAPTLLLASSWHQRPLHPQVFLTRATGTGASTTQGPTSIAITPRGLGWVRTSAACRNSARTPTRTSILHHLPPKSRLLLPPRSLLLPPGSHRLPPHSRRLPPGSRRLPPGSRRLPPGSRRLPQRCHRHLLLSPALLLRPLVS